MRTTVRRDVNMEHLTTFIKQWTPNCPAESSSASMDDSSTNMMFLTNNAPTEQLIQIAPRYNNFDRVELQRAIDLAG